MNPSDRRSSEEEIASFEFVVGVDIGMESCSFCVCTPEKRLLIKPTIMTNAAEGFEQLHEHLQQLAVAPDRILIALEATSRYGENLYHFLESQGYALCLLHPRQTHEFAQRRGLRAKTDKLDAQTIARVRLAWGSPPRLCSQRPDRDLPRVGAFAHSARR